MALGHVQNALPFIHRRIENLQHVKAKRADFDGVQINPLSERGLQFTFDIEHLRAGADRADTDGMRLMMSRQNGHEAHSGAGQLDPIRRRGIRGNIAADEVIDAGD